MHDEVKKYLNDRYIMKKSINSILKDHANQIREILSNKLIGCSVEFNYKKNVVKIGVIKRVVAVYDQNVYVEIEYDGKLSQLSTEDLTFL
ncbi:hypothetical protein QPL51_05070 [Escherichia coli]|uniref:hypothetical protein n=1 Tax=Escherichia coli TaxID=562 RepID=UPI002878AB95|nr:hypothetical protein [Escherichia coli]MDS1552411.1 hypothetical protein [Escherichia coli]